MEHFGVKGVQFALRVVLARILFPKDYGVLSMIIIFADETETEKSWLHRGIAG